MREQGLFFQDREDVSQGSGASSRGETDHSQRLRRQEVCPWVGSGVGGQP